MAMPADGYSVLEHIDDASSAHALDSGRPNPASDLVPLVTSQVTFSQIYIRTNEDRFNDWDSFVEWVKAQGGKATIANVSKEGSMERVTMKFITDATGMSIQQISFDKGAPPETKNRNLPPTLCFTLLYTNLSAILCFNSNTKGSDLFCNLYSVDSLPTPIAHQNIF